MSVFPAFPTSTEPPAHGQEPVPHCDRRQCAVEKGFEDVIYSTTTLKILESVTTIAVFLVSSLLLLVLLIGRRRFTVPFFRILTVLVTVIVTRSVVSIAFKLITLWTGVPIASQNIITLVVDIFSKKMIILLIFLLALNRFAIILYPILDSLLFARYRYIFLCLISFVISAAVTYAVITTSNMRREFVPEIGFVDYIDSAEPYEVHV
ncbi:hypothetical protein OSTOST_13795, partial [Ostertagia ostertagi]